MTEPTENSVRQVLLAAVPPMTDPPDRVAAVKARAARSGRRTTALLVAVVVAVVAAGVAVPALRSVLRPDAPAAPAAPIPVGEECPPGWWPSSEGHGALADVPGQLVPDGGMATLSLCWEVRTKFDPAVTHAMVLTDVGAVGELVASLNELPAAASEGRICFDIAVHPLALVVRYTDRQPVVVRLDMNCGVLRADGHVRELPRGLEAEFVDRYREQLAAGVDPGALPDPTCAAQPANQYNDAGPMTGGMVDDLVRAPFGFESPRPPLLPSPLVSVVACRYVTTGDHLTLAGSRGAREGLGEIQDLLNDADRHRTVAECAVGFDPVTVDRLDVVWVVDATGRAAEMRVRRAPCEVINTAGSGTNAPTDALLRWLDDWLP